MSDDDFLSRWSRRKRADPEEAGKAEQPTAPDPEPETEEEEAALLSRLELPLPESLKPGDDFSRFMADGVPEFLRRRALRVLWRSNPVLANLDGLNDYDEDFTSPELTQKVLATGYKVGRGFVARLVDDDKAKTDAAEVVDPVRPPEKPKEQPVISDEIPTKQDMAAGEDETMPPPRPRRMRFQT